MTVSLTLMIYAASVLVVSNTNRTLTEQYEEQAQRACMILAEGDLSDKVLTSQVFLPGAEALVAHLKMFREQVTQNSGALTQQYVSNESEENNSDAEDMPPPIKATDPAILANAASNIADIIIERYRQELRGNGQSMPAPLTHRSPGENGVGNLPRIAKDVRDYCAKLKDAGVTKLFPVSGGAR
jgi:hypothetical protein